MPKSLPGLFLDPGARISGGGNVADPSAGAGQVRASNGRPGWFSRLLLPAIIFQSVLIGGGYASGREIVEFGAKFGALGVWTVVAIFLGFGLVSMVAFEFARVFRSYDYRTFMRNLIGQGWILFDVLFIVMAVLVIAIVSSAAGEIATSTLGLPYALGVGVVIALVGLVEFFGRRVSETVMTIGTVVLYVGFLLFGLTVLSGRWGVVQDVFARGDASFVPGATAGAALFSGLLYVGYNLVVLPSAFFSLDNQRTRADAVGAGLLTGLMSTLPFILTYLAVLAFYPNEDVLNAPVPWLVMLEQIGAGGIGWIYTVVVFFTLVETGIGLMHAILGRINSALGELGRGALGGRERALITVGVLIAAALMSRFGLIALVAQGYTAMAYSFLILFALPLLTLGIYKIAQTRGRTQAPPA